MAAMLGRVVQSAPPPFLRWLAWKTAGRIQHGTAQAADFLKSLGLLLDGADLSGWGFAAETMLNVLGALGVGREGGAQRIYDKSDGGLAAVAARITWRASSPGDAGAVSTRSWISACWQRWQRAIVRLLRQALKAGLPGQTFVGEFLCQLLQCPEKQPLVEISRRLPALEVEGLLRQWAEGGIDGSAASAEGMLKVRQEQWKKLAGIGPEVQCILRLQQAMQTRLRLRYGEFFGGINDERRLAGGPRGS
jgi:hypothetical protein